MAVSVCLNSSFPFSEPQLYNFLPSIQRAARHPLCAQNQTEMNWWTQWRLVRWDMRADRPLIDEVGSSLNPSFMSNLNTFPQGVLEISHSQIKLCPKNFFFFLWIDCSLGNCWQLSAEFGLDLGFVLAPYKHIFRCYWIELNWIEKYFLNLLGLITVSCLFALSKLHIEELERARAAMTLKTQRLQTFPFHLPVMSHSPRWWRQKNGQNQFLLVLLLIHIHFSPSAWDYDQF